MRRFDIAINSGLVFDGTGRPGRVESLGIRGGRVVEIRENAISADEASECIDARGPCRGRGHSQKPNPRNGRARLLGEPTKWRD